MSAERELRKVVEMEASNKLTDQALQRSSSKGIKRVNKDNQAGPSKSKRVEVEEDRGVDLTQKSEKSEQHQESLFAPRPDIDDILNLKPSKENLQPAEEQDRNTGETNPSAIHDHNKDGYSLDKPVDVQVKEICKDFNAKLQQDRTVIFNKEKVTALDLANENFVCADQADRKKGGNGSVFLLKTKSGERHAVKELDYSKGTKINDNEITIPVVYTGDGIVKIYAIKAVGKKLWIVMENCGSSLRHMFLKGEPSFRQWCKDQRNRIDIKNQLFSTLALLEKRGIVHRDIKPENICAQKNEDGRWIFTLVDFGSVQRRLDKVNFSGLTPFYLTPGLNSLVDMIKKNKTMGPGHNIQYMFFDEKCDVWSMAIVMLEILQDGQHPFPLINDLFQLNQMSKRHHELTEQILEMIKSLRNGYFEPHLSRVEEPMRTILRNILLVKREDAWTGKMALNYSFSSKNMYRTLCPGPIGEPEKIPSFGVGTDAIRVGPCGDGKESIPNPAFGNLSDWNQQQLQQQQPPTVGCGGGGGDGKFGLGNSGGGVGGSKFGLGNSGGGVGGSKFGLGNSNSGGGVGGSKFGLGNSGGAGSIFTGSTAVPTTNLGLFGEKQGQVKLKPSASDSHRKMTRAVFVREEDDCVVGHKGGDSWADQNDYDEGSPMTECTKGLATHLDAGLNVGGVGRKIAARSSTNDKLLPSWNPLNGVQPQIDKDYFPCLGGVGRDANIPVCPE